MLTTLAANPQFQLVLWALVLHAYRTDSRFGDKSTRLGYSFGLSTTAWILDALLAGVMIFTGVYGEWYVVLLLPC